MQTLTFTQKLLRQRRFLSFLLPLFALFVGLSASQQVMGQAAFGSDNITISSSTTGGTATSTTYTGQGTTSPKFQGADLGGGASFDQATGSLTITAASDVIRVFPGTSVSSSSLFYSVYATGATTAHTFSQLPFILTSASNSTDPVSFGVSGATINLLSQPAVLGGGNYTVEIKYLATYNDNSGTPKNIVDPSNTTGAGYIATFSVVAPQPSTATLRNVIVTSGTTASNATTTTYDATATTPGSGVFNGTNFGVLDARAGQLLLQGGSIQIAEKSGDIFDQASIAFVVSPGTLTSPNTGFGSGQTLTLVQTGYNTATKTRTFSLTNAARNILALAMTGGTPGTSYRFDVAVSASGMNAGGNPISILGLRQSSVFTVTGTPVFMPTLTSTTVFIAPSGGPTITYDANNVSANPDFNGANLGTFDIASGQLVLNGGGATTTENGPNEISSVALYFRVRKTGTGGGGYTPLDLTQLTVTTNADGSRTRTFALNNAARNLLAAVTTIGGYNVDAYLEASGANTDTGTFFVITDRSNVAPYTANFTVNGTPIVTTVWTGGLNDNWFDTLNWDNGVPTAIKNAFIPNFPSGNTRPYPNIYSDFIKPPTEQSNSVNPDGTIDIIPASPGYDNIGKGNAMVRNLTLQGNTQLDRSILRLIHGRLDVFGDFDNPQGSFIQRGGTVISFKASGNQSISGSVNGFVNVEIDGGVNSIKTLVNSFTVKSGGTLKFINGILQTNIAKVSTNFISFEGSTTDVNTPNTVIIVPPAQLIGETETSWFRGFLTTTQPATPNIAQNFSNIGLTLTFTGNDPGNTLVTRNSGDNYPQTAFAGSTLNPNANPRPSIRRVFGVQPGNPATQTRSLTADIEFRYLSNELVGVRTFNGGTATTDLDQAKLSLYVSATGGNSFNQLGRDSNIGNVLKKRGVTSFATFTLSEAAVLPPLPVTLTTFDVKRMGADALVTWETASEINSQGFEVQVSTDGKEFRTLGSVPSATPNSTNKTSYRYVDTEPNKVGTRYYRLRQIDVDGKDIFFTPRTVLFTGKALATAMVAYPNPVNGSELNLVLQSVTAGKGTLRITDMTGRVIRQESVELTSGISDLSVKSLGDLKAGLYLVGVTLPTGETQNLKIVKQ